MQFCYIYGKIIHFRQFYYKRINNSIFKVQLAKELIIL